MGNDLISREALKKACSEMVRVSNNSDFTPCPSWNNAMELIDNAQTVIVDNCGECPYYNDRDRDIITEAYNDGYKTAKEDFENHKLVNNSQELVKDLVKEKNERPQGEWIIVKDEKWGDNVKCPFCGKELAGTDLNFCCKCGAKLAGSEKLNAGEEK